MSSRNNRFNRPITLHRRRGERISGKYKTRPKSRTKPTKSERTVGNGQLAQI